MLVVVIVQSLFDFEFFAKWLIKFERDQWWFLGVHVFKVEGITKEFKEFEETV
jgi:hypothetical protein